MTSFPSGISLLTTPVHRAEQLPSLHLKPTGLPIPHLWDKLGKQKSLLSETTIGALFGKATSRRGERCGYASNAPVFIKQQYRCYFRILLGNSLPLV
ncbi:hypothetical protein [Janthinobacterium sp. J1-1]|uniref:hypothetical protein n=1 Tax=Janthinobacterium sp. J1-1 TaxID=3065910 RepID=UPI002810F7F2|nr:hypothetical protein [Janthinobacterium sp. J1-1]